MVFKKSFTVTTPFFAFVSIIFEQDCSTRQSSQLLFSVRSRLSRLKISTFRVYIGLIRLNNGLSLSPVTFEGSKRSFFRLADAEDLRIKTAVIKTF